MKFYDHLYVVHNLVDIFFVQIVQYHRAMDKIEKSFGKGSIMKMGEEVVEQVEVIPTPGYMQEAGCRRL